MILMQMVAVRTHAHAKVKAGGHSVVVLETALE
jgi:hypothetical protein